MKRTLHYVTLIAVLAALLSVGSAARSTPDAEAYCGAGNSHRSQNGYPWGYEASQWVGTCTDGNNIYSGRVYDWQTDGYCVSADFKPDTEYHFNFNLWVVQGYSCTTGAWGYYDYWGLVDCTAYGCGQVNVAEVRICRYGTSVCTLPRLHTGSNI